MDRQFAAEEAIVVAIVSIAIIAMLLLVRGTQAHSRFDDSPVTSRVERVA